MSSQEKGQQLNLPRAAFRSLATQRKINQQHHEAFSIAGWFGMEEIDDHCSSKIKKVMEEQREKQHLRSWRDRFCTSSGSEM